MPVPDSVDLHLLSGVVNGFNLCNNRRGNSGAIHNSCWVAYRFGVCRPREATRFSGLTSETPMTRLMGSFFFQFSLATYLRYSGSGREVCQVPSPCLCACFHVPLFCDQRMPACACTGRTNSQLCCVATWSSFVLLVFRAHGCAVSPQSSACFVEISIPLSSTRRVVHTASSALSRSLPVWILRCSLFSSNAKLVAEQQLRESLQDSFLEYMSR